MRCCRRIEVSTIVSAGAAVLGLAASCGNGAAPPADADDGAIEADVVEDAEDGAGEAEAEGGGDGEDEGEAGEEGEAGAEAEAADVGAGDGPADDGGGPPTCTAEAGGTLARVELVEDAGSGQCRLALRRLAKTSSPPFEVDLGLSPLWQVDLRRQSLIGAPGVLTDYVLVPDAGASPDDPLADLRFPCDRLLLEQVGDAGCRLGWSDLPAGGDGQTLDVRVELAVRSADGMVEWNVVLELTEGDLFIHDVRFPYLATTGLGVDSHDDWVVLSWDGGYGIRDVLGRPNGITDAWDAPAFDTVGHDAAPSILNEDEPWFYGRKETAMQFVACVDRSEERFAGDFVGRPAGGIYLAAEDPAGYLKKIYANKGAPDGSGSAMSRALVMYARHYNSVRHDGATLEAADLRRFDLRERFGYGVVTKVFWGDWATAAELYRAWATNEAVPPLWLPDGTLAARRAAGDLADLSESFLNAMYRKGVPLEASDQAVLEGLVGFVRGGRSPAAPLAVMATSGPTYREFAISAADSCYTPNRPWAHELLRTVAAGTGALFYFNHDTGKAFLRPPVGWRGSSGREVPYDDLDLCGGSEEASWLANDEIGRSGLVFNVDGGIRMMNATDSAYAAASDWWYDERVLRFAKDRFLETATPEGGFGLRGVTLSGTGPVPVECWAPVMDGVSVERHDHDLGGGNYHYLAWRRIMGELYEFASGTTAENPHAIPDFFVTFERSSEMLLDLAVATFNAGPRTPVLVSTGTPGPYNLIWNARRIPLFDAVFRDYGRRGNQSISAEEVRRVFEPSGEDGHLQYQYVRAQVMVGFGQAWGLIVVPEADSAVDQVTEAVMPPAWWEAQVFTRALADVLYAGKDFSVYGRFLRPPQVVSPALETLTVCQVYPRCAAGEFRTHDFPPVLGGAFQAPDGRIGVFLANWTDGERAADVTIDPAWSLADGGAVCRQVFGGPDEAIGTIAGGTAVVSGTLAARTAELLYVVPAPGACGDL